MNAPPSRALKAADSHPRSAAQNELGLSHSGFFIRRITTSRICRRLVLAGCMAAAVLAVAAMLGHLFDPLEFLARLHPRSNQMVWATAIQIVLLIGVLVLQVWYPRWAARKWVGLAVGGWLVLWSVLVLSESGLSRLGLATNWEEFPVVGGLIAAAGASGMAQGSGASFVLEGLAVLALCTRPGRRRAQAAALCAGLTIAFNLVILLGYLYGRGPLSSQPFEKMLIPVSFPTALAQVCVNVALLAAVGPRALFLRNLLGRDTAGLLLRAFLPTILGLIVLGEFVRTQYLATRETNPGSRTKEEQDVVLVIRGLWIYLIGFMVMVIVNLVAGRVGRSLERARSKLNRTLEELRLARERAESATLSRDYFLAQISHELRTPLNHVLGFCQLLELTGLNEGQQRDLQKIHRAGNHLQALIDDILDYQKIIMSQIPMQWEDFDAAPWVLEVVDSMAPKVAEKGNRLEVHCAADLGRIRSDKNRFRQILTNLLSNAAKFTSQGLITVTAAREWQDGQGCVVVRVADTGKGISPENQAKLFKPFGRLSDKRDNPEGTGLGLAICKTLCEKMGGAMAVTSAPDKGSTFSFRLPADTAAEYSGPPSPVPLALAGNKSAPTPAPGQPWTVLVIDDDPQVGELMKRFLEKEGFAIKVAFNGAQALEMVKIVRPAVIVLDVLMPGIDGWGVLAALKNDLEVADIPVIILSIVEDQSRGFLLGANEYVTKPVDWERLGALLRKFRTPAGGGVLVVDDDGPWRELCCRALEASGFSVIQAADGVSGLRRLAEQRPSLILLDLMLPEMDGFEFLETVRRNPEWQGVTIVVMTAKELQAEDRRRLNGRVQEILEKGRRSLDELLGDILRGVKRCAAAPLRPETKELLHAQNPAG
jgi:signal transduction histidine kinase/DNA-binding response OmpR family regulator